MDFDGLITIDVELDSRSVHLIKISYYLLNSFVKIGFAVLVLHVTHWHVNFVFWGKVNAVFVLGDLVGNLCSTNYRGLIGPTTRNISQSISTTSEK